MIHVGIDTVMLKGKGFEAKIKEGDTVKAGQPLISFDAEFVAANAPTLQTAFLIISGESITTAAPGSTVKAGQDTAFMVGEGEVPASEAPVTQEANEATAEQGKTTLVSEEIVVRNPQGLHARPTATLVKIIKGFNSAVKLQNL